MDDSQTRRGRPCWYKVNNIGLAAFNDGILLESGVFQLLRRHIRDEPYYVDIIELFHDVSVKSAFCSYIICFIAVGVRLPILPPRDHIPSATYSLICSKLSSNIIIIIS